MSDGKEPCEEKNDDEKEETAFMRRLKEKTAEMMKMEELDEETAMMVQRMVVLRVATKHINLLARQFEMKRKEINELVVLMKFEAVKNEIGKKEVLKDGRREQKTISTRR